MWSFVTKIYFLFPLLHLPLLHLCYIQIKLIQGTFYNCVCASLSTFLHLQSMQRFRLESNILFFKCILKIFLSVTDKTKALVFNRYATPIFFSICWIFFFSILCTSIIRCRLSYSPVLVPYAELLIIPPPNIFLKERDHYKDQDIDGWILIWNIGTLTGLSWQDSDQWRATVNIVMNFLVP